MATIKKYDNFTVNTKFAVTDSLKHTDDGLAFCSGENKYIIKYVDDKLCFYVVTGGLILTETKSSLIYDLFVEINSILRYYFHFDKTLIQIPSQASVNFTKDLVKPNIDIVFLSSDKIKTNFSISDFAQPPELAISNISNLCYYRVDINHGQTILKMLSLFYILDAKLRNRIVAHCLQYLPNTYFVAIPIDILHSIFNYVI